MKRGLSITDLLNKKYDTIPFEGGWLDAFSTPESTGVWFIWGGSGNGKSRFVLQLCKELCRTGMIGLYNSLEEADAMTLQEAVRETGLQEANRRLRVINENMTDLSERLKKRRSPDFVVIDSFQYSELNYPQYKKFKETHKNKLIIFVSHADGRQPSGRSAKSVMFDASLKIWVEGYTATSKGRYIGTNGGTYTIWKEGAEIYQNNNINQ